VEEPFQLNSPTELLTKQLSPVTRNGTGASSGELSLFPD